MRERERGRAGVSIAFPAQHPLLIPTMSVSSIQHDHLMENWMKKVEHGLKKLWCLVKIYYFYMYRQGFRYVLPIYR